MSIGHQTFPLCPVGTGPGAVLTVRVSPDFKFFSAAWALLWIIELVPNLIPVTVPICHAAAIRAELALPVLRDVRDGLSTAFAKSFSGVHNGKLTFMPVAVGLYCIGRNASQRCDLSIAQTLGDQYLNLPNLLRSHKCLTSYYGDFGAVLLTCFETENKKSPPQT